MIFISRHKLILAPLALLLLFCLPTAAYAAESPGRQAYYAALGDTVEKIAYRYDLDSELVAAMNNMRPEQPLREGQQLWLPLEPQQDHTVAAGDTLWSLARRYSTSVAELCAVNQLAEGAVLRIGQILQLPNTVSGASGAYRMVLARESASSRGGQFIWPVSGAISSAFGWRSRGWHCGLDIAADFGATVVAARAGLVKQAGWRSAAYGNAVEIDHGNGLTTLYAHNSRLLVGEGQFVRQGQAISLVGDTGNATGAHLHLEIRLNQICQNPQQYLR